MAYDLNSNPSRPHDLSGGPPSETGADEFPVEGSKKKSDKTKPIILAVLAVVAVGVVAWQFLHAKGPKDAAAATVAGAADPAAAPGGTDIDAVLRKMNDPGEDEAKGFTVARVEQLVKEFDTYVRHRQVSAQDLRANPFQVLVEAAPPTPVEAKASPAATKSPKDEKAAAEDARKARLREAGARLKLGSILVSAQSRMAVINETVCALGDVVEGFRVESIDRDRVVLSAETYKVELKMFDREVGPAGSKGHS